MDKKRNGLLEIYRFMLCFMPLYYHNFFFLERNYDIFEVPELAVDFFFMLSGLFLMGSMRKLGEERILVGMWKLMFSRAKPMMFTMCFITAFNAICVALFIRERYLHTIFHLFKYWWFVWYLVLAIGILYVVYRLLKSEKRFVVFLVILAAAMATLHYFVVEEGKLITELVFFTRAFGSVSAGILVSYIPRWKNEKFNPAIPAVVVLLPTLLYLYYNDKTFLTCLVMIAMFGALIYFSTHISVGGRVFDLLGKLSVRMYLYMAFLTMLSYLGLTNHRVLFVIDIALASLDLAVDYYRQRYKALKRKTEKAEELVLAAK